MKELIRRLIFAAGYEIRHKSLGTTDPFRQQSVLLAGVETPVIFDVGANIGTIAQKYRHLFPGATIYAFEPFPDVFHELIQRMSGDKRIILCKLALGSAQAKRSLKVNANSATNSLLETEQSAATYWGAGLMDTTRTVEVPVSTIDEFCRERRVETIDILKMDTQGTELEVLKGAAGMLSDARIHVIYTEMLVAPSYKGQSKPHELMAFLDGFGYELSGIYNLWGRKDGGLLQMDAIFVRSQGNGSYGGREAMVDVQSISQQP